MCIADRESGVKDIKPKRSQEDDSTETHPNTTKISWKTLFGCEMDPKCITKRDNPDVFLQQ